MYAEQSSYFNDKLKEAQEQHTADRNAMMKAMNEENLNRVSPYPSYSSSLGKAKERPGDQAER